MNSSRRIKLILLVLLHNVLELAAFCQAGCDCKNVSIECSCKGLVNDTLVLEPFHGLTFMKEVYITDCGELYLKSRTFENMQITGVLTIRNVRNVHLEPETFSKMKLYPSKISIEDSGISVIQKQTFSGISNVSHLWLNNCTIGAVHAYAFLEISGIGYLYFRNCKIEHLATKSLGGIHSVRHLFIQGEHTVINRWSAHSMQDTSVMEIGIKHVHVRDQHINALTGLERFKKLRYDNVTVDNTDLTDSSKIVHSLAGGLVELRNSRWQHFSLGPFSNTHHVQIESCHINELVGLTGDRVHNMSLLLFKNSRIANMRPGALQQANYIKHIRFEGCTLDTLHTESMAQLMDVNQIIIVASKIGVIAEAAFKDAKLNEIVFTESDLEAIKARAFMGVSTKVFEFSSMARLASVHTDAFARLNTHHFRIVNSRVDDLQELAFRQLDCSGQLNISGNTFTQLILNTLHVAGFAASSFRFSHNAFTCSCLDNTGWLQMLTQTMDPDSLMDSPNSLLGSGERSYYNTKRPSSAESQSTSDSSTSDGNFLQMGRINRCVKNAIDPEKTLPTPLTVQQFQTSICSDQHRRAMIIETTDAVGLQCRVFGLSVQCTCGSNRRATVHYESLVKFIPHTTAHLSISGCEALTIANTAFRFANSTSLLSSLSIYSCAQVKLETSALQRLPMLRRLTFVDVHFREIQHQAFDSLPELRQLIFNRCQIDTLPSQLLINSYVNDLSITSSTIRRIQSQPLQKATVNNINITSSIIGIIETHLFNDAHLVRTFTVRKTRIDQFGATSMNTAAQSAITVCFESNTIDCECENAAIIDLLAINQCAISTNLCHMPSSRLNQSIALLIGQSRLFENFCGNNEYAQQQQQRKQQQQSQQQQQRMKQNAPRKSTSEGMRMYRVDMRTCVMGVLMVVVMCWNDRFMHWT